MTYTAAPVIREALRDYMTDQFRKHQTTEFTSGELLRGLTEEGHSYTAAQVKNGLASLKSLNKAVQTRKVPGARGGAMYWALVSVLEAATAPTTKPNANTEKESTAVTGKADVPATRKPRHDDPEHIEHAVTKQLREFEERLTKQFSVMQTDFEQAVKSKITSAMADSAPSASIDHDKLAQLIAELLKSARAAETVNFATIGEKISLDNADHMATVIGIARDFVTGYDATTQMMKEMLIKSVSDDELKEQGFIRGFSVGYEACEARYREAIQREVLNRMDKVAGGIVKEHSEDCPNGNAVVNPLKETLRKLGAQ